MSVDWYRLKSDGTVSRCGTSEEGAVAFNEDRCMARTEFTNGVVISSIFLGLDHSYSSIGPLVLFETMVFNKTEDQYRFTGWEEMLVKHRELVDGLIAEGAVIKEEHVREFDR